VLQEGPQLVWNARFGHLIAGGNTLDCAFVIRSSSFAVDQDNRTLLNSTSAPINAAHEAYSQISKQGRLADAERSGKCRQLTLAK